MGQFYRKPRRLFAKCKYGEGGEGEGTKITRTRARAWLSIMPQPGDEHQHPHKFPGTNVFLCVHHRNLNIARASFAHLISHYEIRGT